MASAFADGAEIASADRLVACDITTRVPSSTVIDAAHEFSGTIYALTADSNGTLYAGGGFTNLEGLPAADNVAYMDGTGWHAIHVSLFGGMTDDGALVAHEPTPVGASMTAR